MTKPLRVALVALCVMIGVPAMAEEAPRVPMSHAEMRAMIHQNAPAVVPIEVVVDMRMSFGGRSREQERKFDALATIINADGLAVTALSRLDPSAMYAQMMRGDDASFSARVKSIKYLMPDGEEIAAAVVLRESELDLVFIKPLEKPSEPLPFVDFSKSIEPEILDPVFVVARTSVIARRAVLGMSGEIQAFIRLPRRFYIPSGELVSGGTGTPIFSAFTGELVGLTTSYTFAGAANAWETGDDPTIQIIVPAEQIHDVAVQAADAKPEVPAEEDEESASDEEGAEDAPM